MHESRAERLLDVARVVGASLDVVEVARRLAREVTRALGADTGVVFERVASGALRPIAGYHVPAALRPGATPRDVPLDGDEFVSAVWRERRAVWASDLRAAPRIGAELWRATPFRAAVFVPLHAADEAIGAVAVLWWTAPHDFDAGEVELVEAIGRHAGVAIGHARLHAESERRRRAAESLARVARVLSEALDPADVAQRITRAACELLGARSAAVYRRDDAGALAREAAGPGDDRSGWPARLPPGTGLAGAAVAGGTAVASSDVLADDRLTHADDARAALADVPTRAGLAVPLRARDRLLGALALADATGRVFAAEEVWLGRAFADQAALALDNARLFAAGERRQRAEQELARVGRTLAQFLDPVIVAREVTASVRALFAVESVALFRHDDASGDLTAHAIDGDLARVLGPTPTFPAGAGFIGLAVAERRIVVTTDFLLDPRVHHDAGMLEKLEAASYRVVAALPLVVRDRVIGVLSVGDRAGRVFDDETLDLLQVFADQAAVALDNARLHDERERRRRAAEVTAELGRSVNASLDLRLVLERVTEAARELSRSDTALIGLRDPATGDLRLGPVAGAPVPDGEPLRAARGRGVAARVLESGTIHRTADHARTRPAAAHDEGAIRSLLAVPIRLGDAVEGVLYVANGTVRPFDDADEAMLAQLADAAAVAIRNAELFSREQAARREAQASEARFRALFDDVPVGLVRTTTTGRILAANRMLVGMLGYPDAATLLQRNIADLYVDPRARRRHLAVLETGVPSTAYEVPLRRLDDSEIWVRVTTRAIRSPDGSVVAYDSALENITERKRAEAALRDRERRFRALIENSVDAIALLAADGRVLYATPSTTRVLGHPARDFGGGNVLDLAHPEDREALARHLAESVARPRAPIRVTARVRHADGAWRLVEGVLTSLLDDPSVGAVVWNYRDETDRRRVEEQMRRTETMDAIGRLAGGVAHDFNNLMTVICSHGELLLHALPGDHPLREDAAIIASAGERASRLTRQLLALGRRQQARPRTLDLDAVVAETMPVLRRLVHAPIELVFTPGAGTGRVRADVAHVEQMVVNLVMNARDAIAGRGRITVETGAVDLGEAHCREHVDATPGPHVVLAVSDTGSGMTPEVRARLFEPFFTTKKPGEGTGLGMATVYSVVKQSGGHVVVESEPGAGTVVRIVLPRVTAEDVAAAPVAHPAAPSEPARADPATVLIVEDDPDVRRTACAIIETCGYRVVEASGPEAALDLAERHAGPFDVALVDIVMPGLSGPQLVPRLLALRPGLPVVYMSGYSAGILQERAVIDGDIPFLPKPFTSEELVGVLRRALATRAD